METNKIGFTSKKLDSPLFTVAIPTYNPDGKFLSTAINSVVSQINNLNEFEILVIDDCSDNLTSRFISNHKYIRYYRNESRLGLAGNLNRCVELANGNLIHILHQDDHILPGFYDKMRRAFMRNPDIDAAFCRHHLIDEKDDILFESRKEAEYDGVLDCFNLRNSEENIVQFASIVVRRATYRKAGHFRQNYRYVLDWDMWRRIGQIGKIYYTPHFFACYRLHSKSETHRLQKDCEDLIETLSWLKSFPGNKRSSRRKAKARLLIRSVSIAFLLKDQGLMAESWNRIFVTAKEAVLFPSILLTILRFIIKAPKEQVIKKVYRHGATF